MSRHLVIANPTAGRGLGKKRIEEARRLLDAEGLSYELFITSAPGEARQVAAREAENFQTLIALGGDGTIQEVAGGLAAARLSAPVPHPDPFANLAILPAGTGNDLIKSLGLPARFDAACQVLLRKRTRDMDLGRIRWRVLDETAPRERIFVNNVGLGFEGQLGWEAAKLKVPLRGLALYMLALLRVLGRLANPTMRIQLGAGEVLSGPKLLVSVGNGHTSGGGFRLNPGADPFDGQLDVCVSEARGRWEVLRLIPKGMRGTHIHLPGVTNRRDTRIEIEAPGGMHGHADGELLGDRICWALFEVLPGMLPVVC